MIAVHELHWKKTIEVLRKVAVKDLVEWVAKSWVDNPDKVQGFQIDGEQSSMIELNVAPEDVGEVIRKQGRNVQAIRIILGAVGMKLKKRSLLELIEIRSFCSVRINVCPGRTPTPACPKSRMLGRGWRG
jgi:uncharacterized protein